MDFDQLKLENQLCFPVYAASRLIIREYKPYLDELGITYPQYLVFMVLWETDNITVNDIAQKLVLNTNTVTPLLKRMETLGFITRTRSSRDERKVIISLTDKGRLMRLKAAKVPEKLVQDLMNSPLSIDDMKALKDKLHQIINYLSKKDNQ